VICLAFWACQPQAPVEEQPSLDLEEAYANPAAEGFDSVNSDRKAVEVADLVMNAMGGRKAWDQTRVLAWDFFGNRRLIWDKLEGDVRIDFPDSSVYLYNVFSDSGMVLQNQQEVTHPDSLSKYLTRARNIWINDSYWLVMPFKLKDSGVTLKYLDLEPADNQSMSHVLQMTFSGVGVTPQNKYLVYVDTATNLVNQWAYYRTFEQDTANFVLPWGNYKQMGKILLSDDRGDRDLSDVHVFDSLPATVFSSFESVDLSLYQ
jgi:hypothetical protein